jgi:PAS domain S-box-containing protein
MHKPQRNQTPGRESFRRVSDVTYAYDLSGNLTFLSEEGERISGYSRAEACRMNIAELLDPEIAGQVGERIVHDASERVGTVYEIDIIAKDGRRVPLEVSTRMVLLREGHGIEIQGIAVPSVIRNPCLSFTGLRCLDEEFFFGSSPTVSDIMIRVS